MVYTVGEMAKLLGITPSALRFYDREGLLPFVERSTSGIRLFTEKDYSWLKIITCLKRAGMNLKDIKKYIDLAMQGDGTIDTRLDMFYRQRENVARQIEEMRKIQQVVEYKCWYYETAKAAGTIDVHQNISDEDIPAHLADVHKELHGEDKFKK